MLTPQDFQDRLLSFKGAAFGLEPVLTQSAWFRPHNSSEEVDRLYLVGAGTHPGAGLPGVLSSARVLDTVVPDAADDRAPLTLPPAGAVLRAGRGLSTPRRCFCRHGCAGRLRRSTPSAGWRTTRSIAWRAVRCRAAATGCASGWSGSMRGGRCPCRSIGRLPTRSSGSASRSAILDALFEGFEWDIEGRRPADLGELHAYAARVAGTVGAMMAVLMGQRSADVVARACDLGVAMQLSNIARDVGEDARVGRLYLPRGLAAGGRHRSRRLAGPAGVQRGAG